MSGSASSEVVSIDWAFEPSTVRYSMLLQQVGWPAKRLELLQDGRVAVDGSPPHGNWSITEAREGVTFALQLTWHYAGCESKLKRHSYRRIPGTEVFVDENIIRAEDYSFLAYRHDRLSY